MFSFMIHNKSPEIELNNKMMHMTFYWGNNVTILFDSWKTTSWFAYFLTLIACFLFSVLFQFMEDRRLRLRLPISSATEINAPLRNPKLLSGGSRARCLGSVLFGVNSGMAYLLMLAVMSFNGGVLVVIVAGLAVGYWLFRSADDEQTRVGFDDSCACC